MARTSTKRVIREMVARIVERFDPERVILFGSHARGDANRNSDVDLLVVMPEVESPIALQIEMRMALNDLDSPKDVVVTTPERYESRRHIPGTLERPASLEGRVLYAKR